MKKHICLDCIHYDMGEDGNGDPYCLCGKGNFEKLWESMSSPWDYGNLIECEDFCSI